MDKRGILTRFDLFNGGSVSTFSFGPITLLNIFLTAKKKEVFCCFVANLVKRFTSACILTHIP